MKTCQHELDKTFFGIFGNKHCKRPLYDDEHCIFHSNKIEKKKRRFNSKFRKEFKRQRNNEERYDFRGFVFPDSFNFKEIKFDKDVYFEEATFSGDTKFEAYTFSKEGMVKFNGANFLKIADFDFATFSGETYFSGVTFSDFANFNHATFNGKASFNKATFSGEFRIWFATFSGEANFQGATFLGEVDFRSATFSGEADFGYAQFFGKTIFNSTIFSGVAGFECIDFICPDKWNMIDTMFLHDVRGLLEFIKLDYKKKGKKKDLEYRRKLEEELRKCGKEIVKLEGDLREITKSFFEIGTQAKKNKDEKKYLEVKRKFEEELKKPKEDKEKNMKKFDTIRCQVTKYKKFRYSQKTRRIRKLFHTLWLIVKTHKADRWRKLFHTLGGLFKTHKAEFLPENFRLILGDNAAAKYPLVKRQIQDDIYLKGYQTKHPCRHYIWWLFADCGRSFFRWAAWSVGIAVAFGFLFCMIGPEAFKYKPEGYTWFSFFYYSIVTFTTLGFGDITPITWGTEILVTIEVILGYVMLGGLISILANKLARRS